MIAVASMMTNETRCPILDDVLAEKAAIATKRGHGAGMQTVEGPECCELPRSEQDKPEPKPYRRRQAKLASSPHRLGAPVALSCACLQLRHQASRDHESQNHKKDVDVGPQAEMRKQACEQRRISNAGFQLKRLLWV